MALVLADFLGLFPEFVAINDELPDMVPAALARAERRVSDSWGDRREDVVGLTAARMLARSPQGRNAQLSTADGGTQYDAELDEMKLGHACARNRAVAEQ